MIEKPKCPACGRPIFVSRIAERNKSFVEEFQAGKSEEEIARNHVIGVQTVHVALRKAGCLEKKETNMSKAKKRRATVLTMRINGYSFKQIGEHLGVSRSRAQQLAMKALRDHYGL